ncbi:MAG: response regulator [Bacteroidales bacterium]|nr:response regulator [Bacteroidales bacterium]
MVSIILKKRGAHVIVADNGQEALEKYSPETIDIILMDIQMPILDGYQTTQKIRKLENKTSTHIPIIALTANALNNEKERCFAQGMDGYLSKPFSIQDLLECIKNTLDAVAIKHKKA